MLNKEFDEIAENWPKQTGNSPFRCNAPLGAIRGIFKIAFYRLFRLGYIWLGDCPTVLGNWLRKVRAPRGG